MGPVEYLIVEFPGNEFSGEIVPALMDLTESGTIHIIDLIFITKDADGDVAWFELDSLESGEAGDYDDLDGDISDQIVVTGFVDTLAGEYTITYTVIDSVGKSSTRCTSSEVLTVSSIYSSRKAMAAAIARPITLPIKSSLVLFLV